MKCRNDYLYTSDEKIMIDKSSELRDKFMVRLLRIQQIKELSAK